MKALLDLQIFVLTTEAGSLSAAARRLDLTPAAASAALRRLEVELGVPLLLRSTRRLRLTPQGELFLQHCRQALDLLDAASQTLRSGQDEVRGTLQISMPSDLGRHRLLPWLDAFQAQYPHVQLRVQLSDRIADVYRQTVDLAIRYGELPDSSLVALPLAPHNRRVLCASPDYLARVGAPASPSDLAQHNCLCYLLGDQVHESWHFERDGRALNVEVRGNRVADDGEAVRRWALAGQGIAYKSRLDVADDLYAGRLVPLCADWLGEPSPLSLMCADRRQLNPAVQRLRDFLALRLAAIAESVDSGAKTRA
jgi:DNA-binding transcriptional LysR family regulator